MYQVLRKAAVSVVFLTLCCGSVNAAGDGANMPITKLDTIVVTSDKQGAEDIQKVPASVSAIPETKLQDEHIKKVEDICPTIPNLNFVEFGASFEQKYFMRGIGSTHNDPAVSFNIDGVTQSRSESSDIPLFDVEQVEVLRGPQGTLYGRNSLGGVINVITKKPDNNLRGKLSGDYGTYGNQEYTGSVSGPIIKDKLFVGLSMLYGKRDGYTENTYLDEQIDYRFRRAGRGALRWLPEDGKEFNLVLNASKDDYGVYALQPIQSVRRDPFKAAFDHEGHDSKAIVGGTLTADIKTSPDSTFTSITGLQNLYLNSDSDGDFTIMDLQVMKHDSENWQLSQELRYAFGKGKDRFRGVFGAYGWYNTQDDETRFINGQDMALFGWTPGDVNKKEFNELGYGGALFGQGTLRLFDKLELTLGLRGEMEHKQAYISDANYLSGEYRETFHKRPTQDYTQFLPKFTLAYHLTENIMPYFTIARGYRAGGFNSMFDSTNTRSLSFDPEYSMNYELGVKSSWFDNKFLANLSAFYITIDNMQVNVGVPNTNLLMVENAGEAESKGVEAELTLRPLPGLEFTGSYGYTNMQFKSFNDSVRNKDYDGKYVPYVPVQNYSLGAQYRVPMNDTFSFFARAEALGKGKHYWDNSNKQSQDEYVLVNAKIGIESENFDIYLYGKNLTGVEYIKTAYQAANTTVYAQSGDPLTVGVNLVYRF